MDCNRQCYKRNIQNEIQKLDKKHMFTNNNCQPQVIEKRDFIIHLMAFFSNFALYLQVITNNNIATKRINYIYLIYFSYFTLTIC